MEKHLPTAAIATGDALVQNLDSGTYLVRKVRAYSVVVGKFTENNLPKGPRGATINKERVAEVQPLLGLMREIGSAHQGKTCGQVSS